MLATPKEIPFNIVNKIIRTMRSLCVKSKVRIENMEYGLTHGRRIKRLHNTAKQYQCFVIGNGPSISEMDLTKLKEEFTFCLNAFILHKDIEAVSPKCYISGNPIMLKGNFFREEVASFLRRNPNIIKVFDYDFSRPVMDVINNLDNVYLVRFNQRRRIKEEGEIFFDPTTKLPASDASVLIQAAIPLAVYMGFRKIFLVGCDCNYKTGKDFGRIDVAHFYKESANMNMKEIFYQSRKKYSDYWNKRSHYEMIVKEWEIVKNCVERIGVEIINAGVGGKLNVFERRSYNDVI